jgi:hypothetical protein
VKELVISSTRGESSSNVIPAEVLRQAQDRELVERPESRMFLTINDAGCPRLTTYRGRLIKSGMTAGTCPV